jgi:hypothetical protein
MHELTQIEHVILARGRVDGQDLEVLRRHLYRDGRQIDRPAADFLVELHKRVGHRSPAFEHFFYQAVKDHILATGRVDAEAARWLRRMLVGDGTLRDEGRKFLHELKGEAGHPGPEFDAVFTEAMKMPPERRTSG